MSIFETKDVEKVHLTLDSKENKTKNKICTETRFRIHLGFLNTRGSFVLTCQHISVMPTLWTNFDVTISSTEEFFTIVVFLWLHLYHNQKGSSLYHIQQKQMPSVGCGSFFPIFFLPNSQKAFAFVEYGTRSCLSGSDRGVIRTLRRGTGSLRHNFQD